MLTYRIVSETGRPEKCFWEADAERRKAETPADRVRRLREVADMPYICSDLCVGGDGCGDAAFWAVVRDGLDALPLLVELLDDASPTRAVVPNFGGSYAVGDVALEAIEEIVHHIPTFELVGVTFDSECGGCAWWRFVRASPANRARVKKAVAAWLRNAKPKLVRSSSNGFENLDCVDYCTHPAGGHYELPSAAVRP
jgi:hypothetical protein